VQLAVIGFIGLCGVLNGRDEVPDEAAEVRARGAGSSRASS
jgi:hypothetical protein